MHCKSLSLEIISILGSNFPVPRSEVNDSASLLMDIAAIIMILIINDVRFEKLNILSRLLWLQSNPSVRL